MNRLTVCKVPTQAGMVGVLGMWLKARSNEFRQLFDAVPGEHARPDLRFSGAVRVLVADDNPVNLMVISAQLEALGLVPVVAYSSTLLDADTLARHGLDGCLPKPCREQLLKACLARWCPTLEPRPSLGFGSTHGSGGPTPTRFRAHTSAPEATVVLPRGKPS